MINQQTKIMRNTQILSAAEIITYNDSKLNEGGMTPWEARFLIGNAKDRQIKKLVKRRADTIGMAIDYISLKTTKQ